MTERLYRLILRLVPRRLRDAHAAEMEELFREQLDAARRRGPRAVVMTWMAALADAAAARRRRSLPPTTRSTSLIGTDIAYALRSLRRQRGSTLLVIVMLTLAIAANIAVFSLVNGLFLRPLPFDRAERLVYFNETAPQWNLDVVGINYPDFDRWRKDARLFDGLALYSSDSFNVADASGAARIRGAEVTWDFPAVLGIRPILGRTFTADEDRPKGPPVIVLGEALWRERFGGDPGVIGRTLRVNGRARTIVGVVPAAGAFPDDSQLWVPLGGDPSQQGESYSYDGIGRPKPGVTVEAAGRDLLRAHQAVWDARDAKHVVSPFVKPLREHYVHDYRSAANVVGSAVALLLLIACGNVAAVMLARALSRRREIGLRLALGSTRTRLLRQLLAENVLLAAAGGLVGIPLGTWALAALVRTIPDELPSWAAFSVDSRVAAFAAGLVAVAVILFGWAPALHAVSGNLRAAVHDTTNGTTRAPNGRRTLWCLIGAEFALAAVLLVSGGLLLKALDRVRHVDPGFRTDNVLTAVIPMNTATHPKEEDWIAFWNRVSDRVAAIPGVDASGLVTCAPFGCHLGNFFRVEGGAPLPDGKNPVVLTRSATAGYFGAMGIRLRQGRFFTPQDGAKGSQLVVIVNETFVRTFWGDDINVVGRRIAFNGDPPDWMTVVGVAGDVKHYGLERSVRPGIYLPLANLPTPVLTLAVHGAVPVESVTPAVRSAIRDLDPEIPLYRMQTMEQTIAKSLSLRTALSWMLAVFAGLAFVLAIGGAYGVATYLVTQRTREIGIRVALGARTSDIFRGIVSRGLAVVAVGAAAGIGASLALTRLLGTALAGVNPRDPLVLAAAGGILLLTGLAANGLPARRAARIDPMRSLRAD
jgi:putative ABC transport system permease protein